MKKLSGLFIAITLGLTVSAQSDPGFVPLKELFKKDFLVGVAVNARTITGEAGKMVLSNFNTLTCENEMKPQNLLYFPRPAMAPQGQNAQQRPAGAPQAGQQGQPPQGGMPPQGFGGFQQGPLKLDTINGLIFNWASADRIADFARQNKMTIRGHTLVWHSQTPAAFFTDDKGNQLTKEQLYERLRIYMTAVMNRYKDVIFCWDVVNEALSDSPDNLLRTTSTWYQICGPDFIPEAFRIAHSINPDVKLIYNDYNLVDPAKLERAITLLKGMKDAGVPVDGVGMQAHWSKEVTGKMLNTAIKRFAKLGLEVQMTELDVTTYSNFHGDGAKNQVKETQPYSKEVEDLLAEKYKTFFEVMHKNARKITSVTFWGLHDGMTWLNGFPVRGRTDYPLLFDREMKPKKAYYSVKSVYQK